VAEVWQRLDEPARQAVTQAQEEAKRLDHHEVGTEHLLAGLLQVKESAGAQVLERLGIPLESIRTELEQQIARGARVTIRCEGDTGHEMPFTPRAQRVLHLAWEEAEARQRDRIGTEYLLLGLLREADGLGGIVLRKLGADPERARAAVAATDTGG
jgi:ATP-dependent Clp protease ATP-binding subunit ClpC